jgi:hypothetical protein
VETQWSSAGNDLFRVTYTSEFVDVHFYTTAAEALLSRSDWGTLIDSTAGGRLTFTVDGLAVIDPATMFSSAPVSIRISRDNIDKAALYYWASSQGQLMTQVFGNTGTPDPVKGDCTSCHSVSRSGSRIGYSRCVGGDCNQIYAGFMRYDTSAKQWVDTVDANQMAINGSYTTFSPIGNPFATDADSVAIVTRNGGSLDTFDPDTGALIPSNLVAASTAGGTKAALMPDWSPDGHHVVFASAPPGGHWIDLDGGAIARVSYAYQDGAHTFGDLEVLVQGPIDRPTGAYTNLFFPSYSADNELIVFNGARASWRSFGVARSPGQRLFLTNADGAWVVELEAMNGGADLIVTWPHWAPGATPDYYWVVFSSERDYGHRITQANSDPSCVANGVQQCKQLWIGADDRKKVKGGGQGTVDPSSPPMWLPGQDQKADNISPYWTVPVTEIPK